jgi:hypothetical protein
VGGGCRWADRWGRTAGRIRGNGFRRRGPHSRLAGELPGLISIGDLNAFRSSAQEAHITFLSEYVYGMA